jgi:16S rRNA (cytosine1402-N4)-methyltransferase
MAGGAAGEPSAADLLAEMEESEIADLFYRFGEERRSRRLARVIVEMRAAAPVDSADRLVEAMGKSLGKFDAADKARIFQALRIAVNEEIPSLERALESFRDVLAPGGVFAILSYHSLEDRLVKNAFREWSRACVCPPQVPRCGCRGVALGETLTRKPTDASPEEVARNPRARSAHLRAWRKG